MDNDLKSLMHAGLARSYKTFIALFTGEGGCFNLISFYILSRDVISWESYSRLRAQRFDGKLEKQEEGATC